MEFKITKSDRNKYLIKPLVFGFVLDISLVFLLSLYFQDDIITTLKIFSGVLFSQTILFYFPLILLYNNYYKANKDIRFIVNGNEFTYLRKEEKNTFNLAEIEKVKLFLSIPKFKGRPIYIFWHELFYAKIITNQKDYIITCLLCESILEQIKDVKVEKESHHLAIIKKQI